MDEPGDDLAGEAGGAVPLEHRSTVAGAAWIVVASAGLVVAAVAVLVALTMAFGARDAAVDTEALPVGHPHHGFVAGRLMIGCPSLAGYALGDRDPLCEAPARRSASFVVFSLAAVAAGLAVARWAWRRGRRALAVPVDGSSRGRPQGASTARTVGLGLVGGGVAVLLLVVAASVVGGPNERRWAAPPPAKDFDEYRPRVQPLILDLLDETEDFQELAHDRNLDFGAWSTVCDRFLTTATDLSWAALPAPDPQLDSLTRTAVAATLDAAKKCGQLAAAGDAGSMVEFIFAMAEVGEPWEAVAARIVEIRGGG